MKIGILADIHGHQKYLKRAIDLLDRRQVDTFIALGDLIEHTSQAAETVAMLQDVEAAAIFGNHELGLCVDSHPQLLQELEPPLIDYFGNLSANWECQDCLFSHTFAHLDAADPLSYYSDAWPDQAGVRRRSFDAFSQRILAIGHFHRCYAATPQHPLNWDGVSPLALHPQRRYLLVIAAVSDGWAGLLDLDNQVLEPVALDT